MQAVIKRVWLYLKQPWRLSVPFKRVGLVVLIFLVVTSSYYWSIKNFSEKKNIIVSIVVVWLLTAYFVLPRLHRVFSRLYLPNYFIGRARTIDGLLADPVNLALRGSEQDLIKAMKKAGWQEADPINLTNSYKIIKATLMGQSYPNAPVSDLFVFGRKQSLAFQKEVDGNPRRRHHVRFWNLDESVYLPGGYDVDWVAAATYDDAVGFSLWTFQITHSIDGDVDKERDFVVDTLREVEATEKVRHISRFFPGYKHRNGGGDKFFTDGSMVIVDLKRSQK